MAPHRTAVCERKQTSADDLISGAKWLIEQGYTCPERLALMGMSNGGLLAAACLVQHPELFGAIVCQSSLMDMIRYHRFTLGAHLVTEDGNAEADSEQFRALFAFSPLHHVRAGENELRAVPAHTMKFAAALQSANASPHPIMMADMVPRDLHGRVSMQSARYWSSCFKHSSLNLFLHGYGNSIELSLK